MKTILRFQNFYMKDFATRIYFSLFFIWAFLWLLMIKQEQMHQEFFMESHAGSSLV